MTVKGVVPDLILSVDIEADATNQKDLNILSLGAVNVDNLNSTFYAEIDAIQRLRGSYAYPSLKIAYLGMSWREFDDVGDPEDTQEWVTQVYHRMQAYGTPLKTVLENFNSWIESIRLPGQDAVLMAAPSSYDTAALVTAYECYKLKPAFSFSGPCLKTLLYSAQAPGANWRSVRTANLHPRFKEGVEENTNPHNALADAIYQARLYQRYRELVKNVEPPLPY